MNKNTKKQLDLLQKQWDRTNTEIELLKTELNVFAAYQINKLNKAKVKIMYFATNLIPRNKK
jgi:hypothetical protein